MRSSSALMISYPCRGFSFRSRRITNLTSPASNIGPRRRRPPGPPHWKPSPPGPKLAAKMSPKPQSSRHLLTIYLPGFPVIARDISYDLAYDTSSSAPRFRPQPLALYCTGANSGWSPGRWDPRHYAGGAMKSDELRTILEQLHAELAGTDPIDATVRERLRALQRDISDALAKAT